MKLKPNEDRTVYTGTCERCEKEIVAYRDTWAGYGGSAARGDIRCEHCDANYNAFGQRLRDDLHSRPNRSEYDEDVSDLDGYEDAMSMAEGPW